MKKETVADAIVKVLSKNPGGLSPKDITAKIIEQKLYTFNSSTPESVVAQTIRKSCVDVDIKISKTDLAKLFKSISAGRYALK